MTPAEARAAFRAGRVTPTAGWCPGYMQANLIAVPADWAYDVLLFCHRNPGPRRRWRGHMLITDRLADLSGRFVPH